ncbi:6-phosphogluconolactonase [Saonia flava]|uniref:6-phosphogluconolactonase n=1 Tax=Saonia flava TaxID=523696 RepID=A0A846QSR8_9FLAO|nr:6-phosphogluconolactonase [Saonia flava]NJB72016.1 6-phosphogluconolactonase [Saonia flava]
MELKIYNSKEAVAQSFSEYLAQLVQANKTTHIALSGGSTPKVVFDYLSKNYRDKIDWSTVHFYWGDERCVPPSDDESNYKMTVEHLLSKINIPNTNVHRVKGEDVPEDEAIVYGQLLEEKLPINNTLPQFDLVILGMGDDGHTASIFPYNIHLWHSENNCEVAIHPDSGQRRVTLTGQVINNAKEVAFLVTGDSKSEKVREIMNKEETASLYPASLVAPTSGILYWFLDTSAAKEITLEQS